MAIQKEISNFKVLYFARFASIMGIRLYFFEKKRFTYLLDNGDKVGAFHGKC